MDLQNFVALPVAVAPVLPAVPVAAVLVLVPVPAAMPVLRQLPGLQERSQPNHHLSYQQTADKSIWQIRLGTTA